MFNLHQPDKALVFNEAYRKLYLDLKEAEARYDWYVRNYATIVEERTYGRKFLDVGYCVDFTIQNMRRRGWCSTGIDLIPGSIITADFEAYDFKHDTFDFILLGDVLQCLDDPMAALRKAYKLLNPCGLMLIITPNSDLIRTGKIADFGHWNMDEHRQFLSRGLLLRMIGRVDETMRGELNVILDLDNFSQRFVSYNNMHILAQKEIIE